MSETTITSEKRPRRRRVTAVAAVSATVLIAGTLLAVGQLAASAASFESSPVGYASMNGGTKGGSTSTVVTVKTAAALK